LDNLLTVAFEAHESELNHHRRYAITIGRDLFDDWTVSIRYGRAGTTGRESRFSGSQVDELRAVVRVRLRRRLSAPRRIGCPYRLTEFTSSAGVDAAAWLPSDIMAQFMNPKVERTVR